MTYYQSDQVSPSYSSLPPDFDAGWIESEAQAQAGETTARVPSINDFVVSYDALLSDHPAIRPEIIEGLLRRGEVMNIVAAPKTGKSWLVHALIVAAAEGAKWLGRQTFVENKVLLIDNELHQETLSQRLKKVRQALKADDTLVSQRLDVMPIRGKSIGLGDIEVMLSGVEPSTYDIIVLDAWYRSIPKGTNENDNSQVMELYNQMDRIAARQGCSIVVIHHTSKGDQSGKSVTDVGAGAGSQSRAADTHMTLRQHENDNMVVVDAVVRSNKPFESVTLEKHPDFEFPLWRLSGEVPVLKTVKRSTEQAKEANDLLAQQQVIDALTSAENHRLGKTELKNLTGWNSDKFSRILHQLIVQKKVQCFERRKRGKKQVFKFVSLCNLRDESLS